MARIEENPQVAEALREKELAEQRVRQAREGARYAQMGPVSQWRYQKQAAAAAAAGAAPGRKGKLKRLSLSEARDWIRAYRADWPQLGLTEADVDDRGPTGRFIEVLAAQGYAISRTGAKRRKGKAKAKRAKAGSKPRKRTTKKRRSSAAKKLREENKALKAKLKSSAKPRKRRKARKARKARKTSKPKSSAKPRKRAKRRPAKSRPTKRRAKK